MFSAQWGCSRHFKVWKVYAKAACLSSLTSGRISKNMGPKNWEQHLVPKYWPRNELLNTHISVSTENVF